MNENILLSICIPTYNRAIYLKDNLEQLLPQILQSEEAIEILVSDNCSTDKTKEVVLLASHKYNIPILYWKNETNIGGNSNIAKVVGQSSGRYVMIMGDDDILSPNFMEIVIPLLKSYKYSIIHWNRLIGNAFCDDNRIQRKHFDGITKELTMLDFLKDTSFDATFISSLIISKDVWKRGEFFMRKEHYGYTWYSRMCYGALKDGRPVFWYYMPLVLHRNPTKEWAKLYPIYLILGLGNIYRDLDKEYPGLLNVGIKWIHQTNVDREIRSMANDQNFYQPYEAEMAQYLTSEEVKLMHYWLHVKNVKWALRREYYIKKFKSLFKNIK